MLLNRVEYGGFKHRPGPTVLTVFASILSTQSIVGGGQVRQITADCQSDPFPHGIARWGLLPWNIDGRFNINKVTKTQISLVLTR